MPDMAAGPVSEPLAILAGGGSLPAEVAAAARAAGRPVTVFAIAGPAGDDLGAFAPVAMKFGQLGFLFRRCRAAGVRDLVVIGGVPRRLPRLSECDLAGLWHVFRNRRLLAAGDDTVLRRVSRLLEAGGLRLVGAAEVAPGLLADEGAHGSIVAPASALLDIAVGRAAARDHGRRDLGQGVVVAGGAVVAREAVDGTDAMLARLAAGSARGGVLVKCAKPQQDLRLDMPAVGPATVAAAHAAGLAGIAVEAGATLIARRAETVAAADAAGLFLHGMTRRGGGA
jgi:DUF1009 family protein